MTTATSTYYVLPVHQALFLVLHMSTWLTPAGILCGRHDYYPYLIDKKTKAQRG